MQITIIGAGNMARGIAIRALAGGHTVRIIDRAPDEAARLAAGLQENAAAADVQAAGATGIGGADIVVLALPYQSGAEQASGGRCGAGGTLLSVGDEVPGQWGGLMRPSQRPPARPMRQRPSRILRWVVTEFGSDAPPDIDPERFAA